MKTIVAFSTRLRDAQRDRARAARADAAEDAFLAREPPRRVLGVGLRDVLDAIDARRDRRSSAGRRRGHLRMPGIDAPSSGCAPMIWIAAILLLQEARHAHDRAGRAHRRHEMRDAPVGVAPDLGTGAAVVRERIVGIGELVEDDALAFVAHRARRCRARLPCRRPSASARARRRTRASSARRSGRLVLRHHQHHPVAAHRRDHRERDAGVAATSPRSACRRA